MVTLGLRATSPASQKARQISVMKKILEERSKMFSQEVCGEVLGGESRGGFDAWRQRVISPI